MNLQKLNPYLVTRIVGVLHHVILLPRSWDLDHLVSFAHVQVTANQLPTCLVLTEQLCVYFREDGSGRKSADVPDAPYLVSSKLAPAEPIPVSPGLSVRRKELERLADELRKRAGTGFLLGDPSKGARFPTEDEKEHLDGTHADGVPKGLLPCPNCGEWRGECFDTLRREFVVRVHCTCENDNRCAACGQLLYALKLNANYFDPVDRKIWHTPAFVGFNHRCPAIDWDTDLRRKDADL